MPSSSSFQMARFSHLLPLQILLLASGALSDATFTFSNNCGYTVWPGLLSGAGTTALSTTGFALQKGESKSVSAPTNWSGRLWGRTLCSTDASSGKFTCGTGDCGTGQVECSGGGAATPTTLAEFTLNGANGLDFYDVSLVDGYNLPMLVVPQGGSGGNCTSTGCLVDLNGVCPSELKVVQSSEGVACRSACDAFQTPQYCCSGAYANPNTCKPTPYSAFFKNACPRAYSYAYDDGTSTFTCAGASYLVTFCPTTSSQKATGETPPANPQAVPLINNTMMFLGGYDMSHADSSSLSRGSSLLLVLVTIFVLSLSRYF